MCITFVQTAMVCMLKHGMRIRAVRTTELRPGPTTNTAHPTPTMYHSCQAQTEEAERNNPWGCCLAAGQLHWVLLLRAAQLTSCMRGSFMYAPIMLGFCIRPETIVWNSCRSKPSNTAHARKQSGRQVLLWRGWVRGGFARRSWLCP